MFIPNAEHEKIFDHVITSENDLMISAVPGAGKTSTIVESVSRLNPMADMLFLAFSKPISDELKRRLPYYVDVFSFHAYGMKTLGNYSNNKIGVEFNKYKPFVSHSGSRLKNSGQVTSYYPLSKLLDLTRLSYTDVFQDDDLAIKALKHMAYTYGINGIACFDEKILDFVRSGILWGIDWFNTTGEVDFCDMLSLPIKLDIEAPKKYEYVVVDELQDLSNIMLEHIDVSVSNYGKLIMVGDENQACFKFAGAGKDSVNEIKRRYNPDTLPLSTCYRCPTSHIDLANSIYSGIRPREGATKGHLLRNDISVSQLVSTAEIGDLIICRRVAPLIETCLDFIFADRPAVVLGKDVKQKLFRTFDEIAAQPKFKYTKIFQAVDSWYEETKQFIEDTYEKPQNAIDDLNDRFNTAISCINAFPTATSIRSLKKQIDLIFKQSDGAVNLASIHSAKGKEANNVTLLEADKLPFKFPGMTDDDKDQERNLQYIAYTRSKDTLRLLSKENE